MSPSSAHRAIVAQLQHKFQSATRKQDCQTATSRLRLHQRMHSSTAAATNGTRAHSILSAPLEQAATRESIGPPEYLQNVYSWAYLDSRTVPWLDHHVIVNAILWGNADKLMEWAVSEFSAGEKVLQAAAVYGEFSPLLAKAVGPTGRLTVVDVANIQVDRIVRKLQDYPWASVRQGDLAEPSSVRGTFDAACCFFLLHEVPADVREKVVYNLLDTVKPGGRVVFVDYHRMHALHPLRPIMTGVFKFLEPYAQGLCNTPIKSIAGDKGKGFEWTEVETKFGGLYQKVVATKPLP